MEKLELTKSDHDLIAAAHAAFEKKQMHDWHGVAAALRLRSGKIITSLVVESEVPSLTICAEPIVIGKSLDFLSEDPAECIVAVRAREESEHKVIPPCGRCREFIIDYCPAADVILFDEATSKLFKTKSVNLLPFKYKAQP